MAKTKVVCAECGVEFLKENKFLNSGVTGLHFCTQVCYRHYHSVVKAGPNSKCGHCSKEFYKSPSEKRKFTSDFCSRSCSAALNNKIRDQSFLKNDIKRNCSGCGKEFIVKVGTTKDIKCWDCRPFSKNLVMQAKRAGVTLKQAWIPKLVMTSCKKCGSSFEFLDKTGFSRQSHCPSCYQKTMSERARKAGLMQNMNRRSKNEIAFHDLCAAQFSKVLANPKMFNGWDADVVIEDLKIAILWNGPWHYRKIKSNHHLGMVQNRDQIKLKEIEKAGYLPYVIKDDGNEDLKFVKEAFTTFLSFVKTLSK
jgi:DNA-directed RNA polymerase subunit RPC12/RpoP